LLYERADSGHYGHNPIHATNPTGKWDSDNDSSAGLALIQIGLDQCQAVMLAWMAPPKKRELSSGRMTVPVGFKNTAKALKEPSTAHLFLR